MGLNDSPVNGRVVPSSLIVKTILYKWRERNFIEIHCLELTLNQEMRYIFNLD